jgi:D-inositol-3-phosphate glycosyltransferase
MKKQILVLYSGHQYDYLYGLLTALRNLKDTDFIIIDSVRYGDEEKKKVISPNIQVIPAIDKSKIGRISFGIELIKYYSLLIYHVAMSPAQVIHIEWFNYISIKFEEFLIPTVAKLFGKKILYKVHDLSKEKLLSDGSSKVISEMTPTRRYFFNRVDKFIVHNKYMRNLLHANGVKPDRIKIIYHGVNNYAENLNIGSLFARTSLHIPQNAKVILFFGAISEYKNLEELIAAFEKINDEDMYLLIAGKYKKGKSHYKEKIDNIIQGCSNRNRILYHAKFINNTDIETYFRAADTIILPYSHIYQSGLIFLAYAYNIPVIAKDIGGLSENIMQKKTGIIYQQNDALDEVIISFFSSKMFSNKVGTSNEISKYVEARLDWKKLSKQYSDVYHNLIHLDARKYDKNH